MFDMSEFAFAALIILMSPHRGARSAASGTLAARVGGKEAQDIEHVAALRS